MHSLISESSLKKLLMPLCCQQTIILSSLMNKEKADAAKGFLFASMNPTTSELKNLTVTALLSERAVNLLLNLSFVDTFDKTLLIHA